MYLTLITLPLLGSIISGFRLGMLIAFYRLRGSITNYYLWII